MKRAKPRTPNTQLNRMAHRWPAFERRFLGSSLEAWIGPLRGFQQDYQVAVIWNYGEGLPPLVHILEPKLKPRGGGSFTDIPHLIFNPTSPEDSALCLFDPELRQWTPAMLIADTTLPWASEWLHHYELWHYDGVWRGPSAPGPRSIGEGLGQDKILPDAAVRP
jgi:hypothetical protein